MNDWKEYRKRYQKRAERILGTLTLDEKISLLSGSASWKEAQGAIRGQLRTHYNEKPYQAGGIARWQVPPVSFVDGTRGVVCGRGRYTCFPVVALRGATFDPELERKVGAAMAEEVLDAGGNFFGGICVNLPYHPGWGRVQESYGEDSFLLGRMGAALVEGVQSRGVIACVKHFACNSMENVRHQVNILCDRRTEREGMLPHFHRCLEAGAGAVMCSYNSYLGEKCGQNPYLIRDVLKGEWAFDGFVISDFTWGITDTGKAINAGMDVEMPNTYYYGERLRELVQKGEVPEEKIDEAALRILRTVLAHQAKCGPRSRQMTEAAFLRHRRLALKCAEEGITLLRNEGGLLPLKAKGRRIAVFGELAALELTGDQGSSRVYPPYVVTALKGIVQSAEGADVVYYDGKSLGHVRDLAKQSDQVIVIAGNSYATEGESIEIDRQGNRHLGGDRKEGLGLGEQDRRLIQAVAETREDAIVVLLGGSMICMEDWCERVGAIVLMYYAGMEGGTALGRILFGKVNPSGKLPFSIVRDEADLPEIDWEAREQRYGYYHGYTLLEHRGREPRYAFGYGLSYTQFRLSEHRAGCADGQLWARVTLENVGKAAGAEVVQLYVGLPDSAVERAGKLLKDFQKIRLKAGEKRTVTLRCPLEEMAYYDEERGRFVCEEGDYVLYVGTSSAREDLTALRVRSNPFPC